MLVFIFVVVLGWASAAPRCCVPRQFESRMGEVGGSVYATNGTPVTSLLNAENYVYADYGTKMMKVVSTMTLLNGTKLLTDVLFDFNKNDVYFKTGSDCRKVKNTGPTMLDPCIPDTALKVEESHIGVGSSAIPFTTWQFIVANSGQIVRVSVTDAGCIPLFESYFGTVFGGSSDLIFIITNFKPNITDMHVFDVPQNCNAVSTLDDLPDVYNRAQMARIQTWANGGIF